MRAAQKPADFDWPAVQLAYETHTLTNAQICEHFDITETQLRYRRQNHGWISQRARVVNRPELINRMMKILEQQVCRLEKPMVNSVDRDIGLLSTASKTLDKLIELQKDSRPSVEDEYEMIEIREKLALRIDQHKRR